MFRRTFPRVYPVLLLASFCILLSVSSTQAGSMASTGSTGSSYKTGLLETDLKPSRPLSLPSGLSEFPVPEIQTISLNYDLFQEFLPQIPKLRLGYLYSFGDSLSWGRMTGDFFVPLGLSRGSTLFGQAHVEFQDYWRLPFAGAHHRVDVSSGAGYRRVLSRNVLLGVNAFYDSTRILSDWYSSAGAGAEAVFMLPNFDIIDLTWNYYGNLSRGRHGSDGQILNGPPNTDFEIGFSHAIFGRNPDFRARINAYNYDTTQNIWGFKGGADLTALDGAMILRAEIGRDQLYGTYQTVGAFVNIPIRLDNVFSFKSPFVAASRSEVPIVQPAGMSCEPGSKSSTGPSNRLTPGEESQGELAPGQMWPNNTYSSLENKGVIPVPIFLEPQNILSFMTEPVRRQFASHAVSVTDIESEEVPQAPETFVASAEPYLVYNLAPKYSAAMLNNVRPSSVTLTATVTSRGASSVTGMQLHIKDTDTVLIIFAPDWSSAMGLKYNFNLTSSQIDDLWRALSESAQRTISEVRFNQSTGLNLRDLQISLIIKQDAPRPTTVVSP